ncbi:MAG: hypothetical protein CAF41_008180 [Nitrospira sp. CG24A]|nr:MAG: hypothetical protein CAF41_008180 [Nitrospira sp. CG24A]
MPSPPAIPISASFPSPIPFTTQPRCEVYPEMACPWVTLYIQLEKIGQVEWMKQV